MTDTTQFEERLGRMLQSYSRLADAEFDAAEIAAATREARLPALAFPRIRPIGRDVQAIWGLVLLLGLLAIVGAYALVGTGPIPQPSVDQRILFLRNGDLYLADQDGSNPTRIRNGAPEDLRQAQFSPSGRTVSALDADGRIQVFGLDGSPIATLAPQQSTDSRFVSYAWSPDGERIAATGWENPHFMVAVFLADGRRVWQARAPYGYSDDPTVAWSPDGTRIAFSGGLPNKTQFRIWVAASDGSGFQRIDAVGDAWLPRWSPDGQRLAVAGETGIWTVAANNTDAQQVSDLDRTWVPGGNWPTDLWYSPDGSLIAAVTDEALWVMRPDGSQLRKVWTVAADMSGTADLHWLADSRRVVLLTLDMDRVPVGLVEIDTASGTGQLLIASLDDFDVGPARQ